MEKKTFGKRIVTPKHVAIAVSIVILFGLFYLNQIQLIAPDFHYTGILSL